MGSDQPRQGIQPVLEAIPAHLVDSAELCSLPNLA